MRIISYFLVTFVVLLPGSSTYAQSWVKMMNDPNANFYDIQKEFNSYWSQPDKKKILEENRLPENKKKGGGETNESEAPGWIQFKRWEWLNEPRVYPSGNLLPPVDYFITLEKKRSSQSTGGNWTFIGMANPPTLSNPYNWPGVGRINCVRFDPVNSNIIYAGTPSGGLWKSNDGGSNWTMWNTDALGSLGVSDLAIDPNNNQVMYIASGDADWGKTFGLGVLKSTDGGLTWNSTGLNWTVTQGRTTNRILIDPTNTQIIHAATSIGIYRSTNGGTTFTQVSSVASIKDLEFKPGDPTTVYASAMNSVYRSTNSGQSYTSIYTVSGAYTLALAVTPANADYLYVLAEDATNDGYLGLYRSTNSGSAFTLRSSTPNILGWDCTGSDTGGQGWYDLCIAASPTNAEGVFIGGAFIWSSTDGGTSWTVKGSYENCADFVFADIHDLIFLPGSSSTVYAGCDGGVFRTQNNGLSWTELDNGLAISEHYSLGLSTTNASLILTSCQDIGTQVRNGTTWIQTDAAEASKSFIDRTNDNIMYSGGYNGYFMRSTDGSITWVDIQTGLTGSGAWVSPWKQDLDDPATLWAGYQEIFKSVNQGTNWTQVSILGGTECFSAIDLSPSNHQVIYASRPTSMIKTTTGGTAWTTITGNLPVGSASITNIEVDPTDENHVWVTFSGYSAANKVWVTINGGTSWSNYSTGLPNLPANCIVYENNSPNGTLYVGTDVGVYCRNTAMPAWTLFSSGLPNVVVSELEIQYSMGKIRAATYGRGMWESDLADIALGISTPYNESQVKIYPNPSKGLFTIKAEKLKIKKIELYNAIGERLYQLTNQQIVNSTIDLSSFANGIYFIHVICDEGTIMKKITIFK